MVSNAKINRQWVLRQRPKGLVQPGDLELVETPVPEVKESEVLVRTVYLSLDPTNRTWMNDSEGYLPPVGLGEVMRGLTLGVVEHSRSDRFKVGDVVEGKRSGWLCAVVQEHANGTIDVRVEGDASTNPNAGRTFTQRPKSDFKHATKQDGDAHASRSNPIDIMLFSTT